MSISLEFTLTAADLRETMRACGSRRFSLLRILVAGIVVLLGLQHLSNVGLDWIFGLYLLFAAYLASNQFIVVWLLPIIMRLSTQPPTFRMSISDQSILIEQTKYRQDFSWSSFAMTGTAHEFENHFWLECGRGNVWIPKRAFVTADDMAMFRALVKEKMGERCQFNQ